MKRLFEFSVKQPLFVNLLTIFIVVAGIMALTRLNREIFPNISLDIVIVNTAYPGSTPQEIEKLITIPIEKELKEVADIKEMTSVSLEGLSTIALEIEPDAPNKDKTVNDIQRAVDRAEDLPEDLQDDPVVIELESRNRPVVEVSLSSNLPEHKLIDHARVLERRLLDMPGIAKVNRSGWRDEEFWVEVDPQQVADYRLSLAEIVGALAERNVSVPGGTVVIGPKEKLIRTTGEFYTAPEIEKVVLRANELGHWVQVEDVATVTATFEPFQTISRTDGARAINLVAVKKERADVLDTVDEIKRIAEEYEAQQGGAIRVDLVNDMSYYVRRRLNVLVNNGWVGIVLVVICLFLFLSSRAAIVTALGIPIAFLLTFLVMYWSGVTINLLTMFGLIMVLGMIVDDAIILAENVHRLIDEGMPPVRAAIEGASDIWKPVTTSVLTTIAAFAPLMFMGGIIGKFVLYIPLVVIIALLASLTEAFIILPSHLVSAESLPRCKAAACLKLDAFNRWFKRLIERYVRFLQRLVRHRWKVVGGFVLFMIVSLYVGFGILPYVLFPQRGIEAFFVRVKAPIGTEVEVTEELMLPLERLVAQLPETELDNFVTAVGVQQDDDSDPGGERASHMGQIAVFLKPATDREMTSDEIIERLRERSKGIEGFTEIAFENVRPGPPVGKAVEIRVRGDDLEQLDGIADEMKAFLASIPGVSDIRDNYEEGKGELRVVVDEAQASRADLGVEDVALAVRTAFEGAIATTIKESDEEVDVRVRFPDRWRYREGALEQVMIPTTGGHLVPITAVASFEESPGVNAIRHHDRKRTVTVTANVDEDQATATSVHDAVVERFADLGERFPGVTLDFGGEYERTQESFQDLKMAMIMAVFVIFIILTFEFHSLLQPLIVLLAVPYGFIGIVWAFLFHLEPKSFLAMMGAVGLAGVVVNNSIVLIDFTNKAQAKGLVMRDAIIEAARLRMRPIVLTTVTTVLGLLPVAYGIMGSDPFLKPMALAIGWGLVFATGCTLLVTPCLYAAVYDVHEWAMHHIRFWKNNRNNQKNGTT